MTGRLTTHALDSIKGGGAGGMVVEVRRLSPEPAEMPTVTLDAGGRGALIEDDLLAGVYELTFHVAAYHRAQGLELPRPPFLDLVPVRFGIGSAEGHHHVPFLFSLHSTSAYRGG